jgi:hypothetical protein
MAKDEQVQHDVEIDGRFYFVWIVPFAGESYANVYGRDVTERKQAEDTLQRRTLELQHLAETLEERQGKDCGACESFFPARFCPGG